MKYLLDANVISHIVNLHQGYERIEKAIDRVGLKSCALSAITIDELHFAILTGPQRGKAAQVRIMKAMIDSLQKLEFTPDAARRSAKVRFDSARQPLPYADSLLAGHALAAKRVLVSDDAVFARIAGLKLQNWRV